MRNIKIKRTTVIILMGIILAVVLAVVLIISFNKFVRSKPSICKSASNFKLESDAKSQ